MFIYVSFYLLIFYQYLPAQIKNKYRLFMHVMPDTDCLWSIC